MNYLELCQELVRELGLAGGAGPSSVLNQTGELLNVTRWIRDSCTDIDNQWKTWKYLRCQYDGVAQLGDRVPTAPNNPTGVLVRKWDRDSLVINTNSLNAKPLRWEAWEVFRKLRQIGSAFVTTGEPAVFSIREINGGTQLVLFPTPDASYPISGEFWRRPPRLAVDTDVPLMPEEYHRLIVATAAIKYGNREDAGEIIAGMEAEYTDKLTKLQSDQAEGFEADTESTQDILLEGAIPGVEWGD